MTAEAPSILYRVSVRELCAFTAKSGDLDLRFTPAPTSAEGQLGHVRVTAGRGPGYQREVPLSRQYQNLEVRGRADGYWPRQQALEEIKTHRGAVTRIPAHHRALHWAQLKLYGAMLCHQQGLPTLRLTVVYFDLDREHETPFTEDFDAATLHRFFDTLAQRFLDWALQQGAHRLRRNAAMAALEFPYPAMYAGQRGLAEAVYRRCRDGGALLAQAPTGIGKTLGTLFPTLKAMPLGDIDRVFYLTARTTGRRLALDALAKLRSDTGSDPPRLRVLELVSRDNACEHPDKACHGESCPLARGFYDRLPAARAAAQSIESWDQVRVRGLAREHGICPYYLGQELARWSDVVVGDVNYYFDSSALLHALRQANDWRVVVLVDEAHNLIERGRAMYSAALDPHGFAELRQPAPASLKRGLDTVNRAWNRVHAAQTRDYEVRTELPTSLLDALARLNSAINDHLADQPDSLTPPLQRFHFDALHWRSLAERFGAHSLFDVTLEPRRGARGRSRARLCIRNVLPAAFLAERFAAAHACVLFSATLQPFDYYRQLLGLPSATPALDLPSPFAPDQLAVRIAANISTRLADRAASVPPIVHIIGRQFEARPGNYLVFLSSFDYLHAVADAFVDRHPEVPTWRQGRGMREPERQDFLQRFRPQGQGVGFAVLGGVFAEGVDLPGTRLIGAFVATLGLPQVNPVNEEFSRRLDLLFGRPCGNDYTYLFPGVRKVAQASGRVIRTPQDRGVVVLIDDRYARARIRRLLPTWWGPAERYAQGPGKA